MRVQVEVPDDAPTTAEQPPEEVDDTSRVLIVDGHGASMRIVGGQLRIEDKPYGKVHRVRLLNRGTTQAQRIIVLSRDGWMSLPVIGWCEALGIHLVILDRATGGLAVQTQAFTPDDARLRRAQAQAFESDQGLEIARYLLGLKCAGQRENLARLGYDTPEIHWLCERAEQGRTRRECLDAENRLAAIYWDCWALLNVPLAAKRPARIPQHWLTVGPRFNPKTRSPRAAVSPAHAILNYVYALAKAETTIALHATGLDPRLGIVHADTPRRNNMALDCVEAIRPAVDRYVLDLIELRMLSRDDFAETETGEVQLSRSLRSELGATMLHWGTAIAPIVEDVANLLRPLNAVGRKIVPTPLTGRNKREAQAAIKASRGRTAPPARRRGNDKVSATSMLAMMPRLDGEQRRKYWLSSLYPSVKGMSTARLAEVTGLSKPHLRTVKNGSRVPHPKYWPAFLSAINNKENDR